MTRRWSPWLQPHRFGKIARVTARKLEESQVALNGSELAVAADRALPVIKGQLVPPGGSAWRRRASASW